MSIGRAQRDGEVRPVGVFENRPEILCKMAARLGKGGRRLRFCYEAGPCGYGLPRLLTGYGHSCIVVAPSLIPMKSGDRLKTDRRDARLLAKLHRAGELTAIWIPDAAHEAMRDLVRARATFGQVLSKAISCRALARRRKSPTSATIVTAITKAGNALARRVLIEGTWTYRMTAPVSRKLHDSLEPLSAAIRDIAWKAQVRLCARYRRLAASGKPKVVVTTATAREMADFIWAIAQRCALPEAGPRWEILRPVMSRSPDRSSSLE